jgi:hypothetical protein
VQTVRSNGTRGRVNRDPDRRPTRPNGYWPLPDGHQLLVCGRCCAAVPNTERAQRGHRDFHVQVDSHDAR